MKMCNVGSVDRAFRICLGSGCVVLGFFAPAMGATLGWQMGLYVIGGIGIVTGLITVCPLYALLGINTCKPQS